MTDIATADGWHRMSEWHMQKRIGTDMWTISKALVHGEPRYSLHKGERLYVHKYFGSAAEAMGEAERATV